MEISRRNLLRMAVVGGGAILIGYGLLRYFSSPSSPKKIIGPAGGKVVEIISSSRVGTRLANDDVVGLSIVKGYGMWGKWDRVSGRDVWVQRQIKRALELGLGASRGEIEVAGEAIDGEEISSLM